MALRKLFGKEDVKAEAETGHDVFEETERMTEKIKKVIANASEEKKKLRPEVRPHAFVVMPFGKKKGGDGSPYDFNVIYQTLKLWSTGPISDDECNQNDYFVGAEFDMGMIFNIGSYINIDIDFGIFMPQTAYSDRSPKFKMGATFGVTF